MAAISLRLLAGRWKTVALLAAGLVVGLLLGGGGDASTAQDAGHVHAKSEAETQWYLLDSSPGAAQ